MGNEISDLTKRISVGSKCSFQKLLEEKAKQDEELIFSKNGKIVRVKAKNLLNK